MMKYLLNRLLCSVFILIPAGLVFADCNGINESDFENIVKRATKNALPAAGFYYQKNDCTIQLTEGFSNLTTKTKIKNNARFDIGSVTKTFVAVTSVKLAKAGAFNLDDTLQQWLPAEITDHIPKSNIITIRQLLSHTSGIVDYLDQEFFEVFVTNPLKQWTEMEALQFVFDKALLFESGTQFDYSNTNYLLMGLIINSATGKPFATNIRELILEPLGLKDTFHLSEPDYYLDYAHGYMNINGVLQNTHEIVKSIPVADGQMISSMHDLAVFIQAIFINKTFMDDASLEILLSSPVVDSNYKLGIGIRIKNNKVTYGHGGSEPGYETELQYTPATNETTVNFMTGNSLVGSEDSGFFAVEDDMAIFGGAYSYELKRAFLNIQ